MMTNSDGQDAVFTSVFLGPSKGAKKCADGADASNLPLQQISYGAPGTGKSHAVEEIVTSYDDTVRTTFHPDSDYSTFVGCYKPTMVTQVKYGLQGEPIKAEGKAVMEDVIAYSFVAQAFTKAYIRAWTKMAEAAAIAPKPQFLVIEEINRGNCAQIFGDLFQLLDRDDIGYSKYAIEADADLAKYIQKKFAEAKGTMPDEVRSGRKLLLPPNLYIWATMNTSDQSLFPIDSAFKRRWDWRYVPISDAGKGWKIEVDDASYDWWEFLEKANALVQETTESEDKKLGYFFVKAKDGVVTLEQFVGKVVFYLWNDVFKNGDLPAVLAESEDGNFTFGKFFKNDGTPNGAVVKAFLEKLGLKAETVGGDAVGGGVAEHVSE